MEMADGDRFTPEQAEALSALRDGRNVFLSGNAGTGKSYVLNAFISDLKARNVDFLALAPGEKEPRSERCYCIVNPGLQ